MQPLTIDDLEARKRLAHYQALAKEASDPRNWALNTLAHYRNLVERSGS